MHFILNSIYHSTAAPFPGEMLEKLDNSMRALLKRETPDASDGMDIALYRIEKETREVIFSGANRNIYQDKSRDEVIEYEGVRNGVGGKHPKKPNFANHTLILETNNRLVTYTGGIQYQFGIKNTKFGEQGVNRSIIDNFDKASTGSEMCSALKKDLGEHQGTTAQIDDILLIRIKI